LELEEEEEEADMGEEVWAEAGDKGALWPRIASVPVAARSFPIAWESLAFRPPAPTAVPP
jgi:hypothetical protein